MGVVECAGDGVEIVFEQVRVGVERHGRGGVSEHPLHDFHVCTRADGEGCGGVPQVVGRHAREPGVLGLRAFDRGGEPSGLRAGRAEVLPAVAEHEVTRALPVDGGDDERCEELGVWDGPGAVGLGGSDVDGAVA